MIKKYLLIVYTNHFFLRLLQRPGSQVYDCFEQGQEWAIPKHALKTCLPGKEPGLKRACYAGSRTPKHRDTARWRPRPIPQTP